MIRSPRPFVLALLLGFLSAAAPARAADTDMGGSTPAQAQKTTAELFSDLPGDNGPDRVYAARALKGQLARAQRAVAHAPEGSLARDDGLATLDEFEARLPEACRAALQFRNVVAPAAEMLAMLGTRDALADIQAAAASETRTGAKRRLDRAIAQLSAP